MSVAAYHRPGSKRKILAGDVPHWIANSERRKYLEAVCLSYPLWVDHRDIDMLKHWADAMSVFHGQRYVLDHIIPVLHPRVCGLSVPWNFQVIHWKANGVKSNYWEPDQLELF